MMSLRTKTALIIGTALTALILVLYVFLSQNLLQGFQHVETTSANQSVERVISAIQAQQLDLKRASVDWAVWDDAYQFVKDRNQGFIDNNLAPNSLSPINVDLMLFYDQDRRLVYSIEYDWPTERPQAASQDLVDQLARHPEELEITHSTEAQTGLVYVSGRPLLVALHPITDTQGKKSPDGVLVLGRYLDSALQEWISTLTQLPFEITTVDQAGKMPGFQDALAALQSGQQTALHTVNDAKLIGYRLVNDLYGQPSIAIGVTIARLDYLEGQMALRSLIGSLTAVGLVFILITIFLSDRVIVSRMVHLSRDVTAIGQRGDLSGRLPDSGTDEIGRLGSSINQMLTQIAEAQDREAENEERYGLMVHQAREGIALVDAISGEILDANDAFRHLVGVAAEKPGPLSLASQPVASVASVASVAGEDLFNMLQTHSDEGEPALFEHRFSGPDGAAIDVEVSWDRMAYRDRDVYYIILRDITERKRLEDERQQLMADTFEKAHENARLFMEGQQELQQRQQMEAKLSRREGKLASLVAFQNELLGSTAKPLELKAIANGLGALSGASRLAYYETSSNLDGETHAKLKIAWVAEKCAAEEMASFRPQLVYQKDIPNFCDELVGGHSILSAADVPHPEAESLGVAGISSLAVFPIRVHGAFFGFLYLENRDADNPWDESEIDVLRSAISAVALAYERQMAEEVSRSRASELQALFNGLPETYLRIDREGRILDSHFDGPATEQPQNGHEAHVHDIYPAGVAQQIYDSVQQVLRSGHTVSIEYAQSGAEGQRVFDARLSPIPGGQVQALVRDISERKQIEQTLRKSEESIRSLYNITSSQQLNFSEKIQALLRVGCQHFGMENGVLGRVSGEHFEVMEACSPSRHALMGMTYPIPETFCRDTLLAGGPMALNHIVRNNWETHPKYSLRNVEAYLGTPLIVAGAVYGTLGFSSSTPHPQPFLNTDKEFLRLMAQWIGSEIDSEQNTQQLQRYAQEIARKNQALAEARDEAVTASRQKSEFLATMSHEIRTPMNAIIGMTDLLLEAALEKEQHEYATIIHDSAQVLLSLLNDILDFSKIEAGKVELEEIEYEPQSVVERTVELFISRAREKGLELMSFVDPQAPAKLMGDPTRLTQILLNLIGNAIKFTAQGEIAVQVGVESLGEQDCLLRFSVTDTGIGMSEAAKARLFQPFTQAEGSISRKYGGTGLGLAISKSLAEMMGGAIGVDSQEGIGSTFSFTARFRYPAAGNGKVAGKLIHGADGQRVLIVDRSMRNCKFLGSYLAHAGLDVTLAGTGEAALTLMRDAQAAGRPFRFTLIEMSLADTNAYSFVRQVQAMTDLTQPHFALVTSIDERDQAEQALQSGFAGFLKKPVRREQLYQMAGSLLSSEPGNAESTCTAGTRLPQGEGPEGKITPAQAAALPPILLAEDNLANQKLATIQLQKLGYRVVVVSDGRQVLDAVLKTNQKFSLLLCDCQMPEVDGFNVTRIIRKAELASGRHLPIVAMTANAMQGDRELCLASGMDDYVSKPVKLNDLRGALERWLGEEVHPKMVPSIQDLLALEELEAAIDPAAIADLRALEGEGEDFLTPLIDTYLQEADELVEHLGITQAAGDAGEVRRLAHKLKGSSLNLGAHCLADLCLQMEKAVREERLNELADLVARVEREYARVTQALEAEKNVGKLAGEKA